MNKLHIARLPHGRFVLIGSAEEAKAFASRYPQHDLDSRTLADTHYVSTDWLCENDIQKVIIL
jgi:hypothetical protein